MSTEENKSEKPNAENAEENQSDAKPGDEPLSDSDKSDQSLGADLGAASTVELQEENAALKDKLVRTLADMENLRSRTEREKNDMAKYAIANFARDILTTSDNLSRALGSVPEDALDETPALKALTEGVELTNREFHITLERHGVRKIPAKDHPFDPNLHDAMFEVPNPEINAGMVVEVVHEGYTIGERVLRPSAVGVSKGGPKLAKEDAPASDQAKPETDPAASSEKDKPAQPQDKDPGTQAGKDDEKQASPSSENMGEKIDKSA